MQCVCQKQDISEAQEDLRKSAISMREKSKDLDAKLINSANTINETADMIQSDIDIASAQTSSALSLLRTDQDLFVKNLDTLSEQATSLQNCLQAIIARKECEMYQQRPSLGLPVLLLERNNSQNLLNHNPAIGIEHSSL